MISSTIFAGFTGPRLLIGAVIAAIFYGVIATCILILVFQTVRSIKSPITKNGTDRRKAVKIGWLCVVGLLFLNGLIIFVSLISSNSSSKKFKAHHTNLVVAYAKTYQDPVIIPADGKYKIYFDDKWGQIELFFPNADSSYTSIIQVPITEVGKKYFNPADGYCDFSSMRENYDILYRSEEACQKISTINNFVVYKSSYDNYYATHKNIALSIKQNRPPLTVDEVTTIVSNLKVTDSTELVKVMSGEHYSGAYSGAIDNWHKEGKF